MDIELDLSVCVVTRNRGKDVLALLHSLYETADPIAFEAIVVDNHSQDDTPELVAREYPQVLLYENTVEEPFAKAQNRAIRLAKGRYIALVADGAVIQPHCLARLLAFLDDNPAVGIAGPKIINPATGAVQPSARSFPSLLSMLSTTTSQKAMFSSSPWMRKYLLTKWDRTSTREVDWIVGNCQIIRREVLEEIGLPDEGFLGLYEDADYCRRARKCGWHIYYVHDAVIHCCLPPFGTDPKSKANPSASAIRYLLKRWFNAN